MSATAITPVSMFRRTSSADKPINFRTAYCKWRQIPSERFEEEVLTGALTRRARLIRPLISFFHHDAFHAERSLVRQAGDKIDFEDIKLDIDFYQHKNVVDSFTRATLRFRLSGIRLQRLARKAFCATASRSDAGPHGAFPAGG